MSKFLIILFAVLLVFLFGRLWFGTGSFPQIWSMQDKVESLATANQQQLEKNRKLEAEVEQFQEGTEAIEARARSDFGMIKKGETFYQVILKPENSDTSGEETTTDKGTMPQTGTGNQ